VWEEAEEKMRKLLGKDVSILRRTVKGERVRLTLKELREKLDNEYQLTLDESCDWGGCGCAVD